MNAFLSDRAFFYAHHYMDQRDNRQSGSFRCTFRTCCLGLLLVLFATGCATTRTVPRQVEGTSIQREFGVASYYADKYHGRKTASGETYNMHEMTAAHRRLPFGTKVRVTNLDNNSSVLVRINDRGPFVKGRVIDLSLAAARRLDMVRSGVAKVEVVPVSTEKKRSVAAVP